MFPGDLKHRQLSSATADTTSPPSCLAEDSDDQQGIGPHLRLCAADLIEPGLKTNFLEYNFEYIF